METAKAKEKNDSKGSRSKSHKSDLQSNVAALPNGQQKVTSSSRTCDQSIPNGSEDEDEDMLDLSSNQSSNFSNLRSPCSVSRGGQEENLLTNGVRVSHTVSCIGSTTNNFNHEFGGSSNGGSDDSNASIKGGEGEGHGYDEDDDDDKSPAPLKIAEQDDELENCLGCEETESESSKNVGNGMPSCSASKANTNKRVMCKDSESSDS